MIINKNENIRKDLKRILCASTFFVVTLIDVMIFSPLATQSDDNGLNRGTACAWELDRLLETEGVSDCIA